MYSLKHLKKGWVTATVMIIMFWWPKYKGLNVEVTSYMVKYSCYPAGLAKQLQLVTVLEITERVHRDILIRAIYPDATLWYSRMCFPCRMKKNILRRRRRYVACPDFFSYSYLMNANTNRIGWNSVSAHVIFTSLPKFLVHTLFFWAIIQCHYVLILE